MTPQNAPKWIKPVVDFGPILIFFVVSKLAGIMAATAAIIIATLLALALGYWATRRLAVMPLVTAIVVTIFGGLTLWFDDETFFKMKPTIVQALFAAILFGGLLLKRPTLQYVLGEAFKLTDEGWWQLTWRYAFFFVAMAVLNEIVWRHVSTDTWVDFKVFGILGLTVLFSLTQMPLMKRHMIDTGSEQG